jgi:hypothetical protein
MNNTIIDIDNYKTIIDNIILSKKISFDNTSKYFIYSYDSKNDNADLCNLLLRIPPIRLLYNYTNQTYNQVNFPLNPVYNKTKKFSNLIDTLENTLQELLNKPKLEWISNLKKIKTIKNIKLNYFGKNDIKIVSENDIVQDIKNFEAGSEVEIIVHLSHIWVKDNRMGISYDITQIKYNTLKNMLKQDFFTQDKQLINKPREPTIFQNNKARLDAKRPSMMPSALMLGEQRSKLRKYDGT